MSSSESFKNYVLENLKDLNGISYRPMMGEYLLYCNGVLFGGIYDDRLLIKKTQTNAEFSLQEEIPYKGAKPMLLAEPDDKDFLINLIRATLKGIK